MSSWEERRLTITANDLLRKQAPVAAAPPVATPLPASWLQRKLAGANGWPWREIMTTAGVCVAVAVVVVLILNSGWTLPSLPRRRPVPALTTPAPVPVEPTARVVQDEPPVIIVVTATPMPAPVQVAPVAPRQVAPAVSQPAPMPTARPRIQPTVPPPPSPVVGGPVRAAAPVAQQTSDAGPQQRLLSRPCEYRRTQYPQGTIIQGYYTDASGRPRDAVCRADGWKAVD